MENNAAVFIRGVFISRETLGPAAHDFHYAIAFAVDETNEFAL